MPKTIKETWSGVAHAMTYSLYDSRRDDARRKGQRTDSDDPGPWSERSTATPTRTQLLRQSTH